MQDWSSAEFDIGPYQLEQFQLTFRQGACFVVQGDWHMLFVCRIA